MLPFLFLCIFLAPIFACKQNHVHVYHQMASCPEALLEALDVNAIHLNEKAIINYINCLSLEKKKLEFQAIEEIAIATLDNRSIELRNSLFSYYDEMEYEDDIKTKMLIEKQFERRWLGNVCRILTDQMFDSETISEIINILTRQYNDSAKSVALNLSAMDALLCSGGETVGVLIDMSKKSKNLKHLLLGILLLDDVKLMQEVERNVKPLIMEDEPMVSEAAALLLARFPRNKEIVMDVAKKAIKRNDDVSKLNAIQIMYKVSKKEAKVSTENLFASNLVKEDYAIIILIQMLIENDVKINASSVIQYLKSDNSDLVFQTVMFMMINHKKLMKFIVDNNLHGISDQVYFYYNNLDEIM